MTTGVDFSFFSFLFWSFLFFAFLFFSFLFCLAGGSSWAKLYLHESPGLDGGIGPHNGVVQLLHLPLCMESLYARLPHGLAALQAVQGLCQLLLSVLLACKFSYRA